MSESPRDFNGALLFAQGQAVRPSQDWTGMCQSFVRQSYGLPALFASAWAQWLGADDEDRHPGGSPADAPLGSALCYKGSGPFGHIMLAARPFGNGTAAAWSNDLVKYGEIDKVARTAATTQWGQTYLGYLTAVNDYDLQLQQAKAPRPKQNKRYTAVKKAADRLELALERAKRQGDRADVKTLSAEIDRLHQMYKRLQRS